MEASFSVSSLDLRLKLELLRIEKSTGQTSPLHKVLAPTIIGSIPSAKTYTPKSKPKSSPPTLKGLEAEEMRQTIESARQMEKSLSARKEKNSSPKNRDKDLSSAGVNTIPDNSLSLHRPQQIKVKKNRHKNLISIHKIEKETSIHPILSPRSSLIDSKKMSSAEKPLVERVSARSAAIFNHSDSIDEVLAKFDSYKTRPSKQLGLLVDLSKERFLLLRADLQKVIQGKLDHHSKKHIKKIIKQLNSDTARARFYEIFLQCKNPKNLKFQKWIFDNDDLHIRLLQPLILALDDNHILTIPEKIKKKQLFSTNKSLMSFILEKMQSLKNTDGQIAKNLLVFTNKYLDLLSPNEIYEIESILKELERSSKNFANVAKIHDDLKNTVKIASKKIFARHLVAVLLEEPTEGMCNDIIFGYNRFTDTHHLLSAIHNEYRFLDNEQVELKCNIINLCIGFLTNKLINSSEDLALISKIAIDDSCKTEKLKLRISELQTLLSAERNSQEILEFSWKNEVDSKFSALKIVSWKKIKKDIKNRKEIQLHIKSMAQDANNHCLAILKSITFEELLQAKNNIGANNVNTYVQLFDLVSRFVQSEIEDTSGTSSRALMIEFFIQLAEHLLEKKKNIHLSYAISSAIINARRSEVTIESINPELKVRYQLIKAQFEHNFKDIRDRMAKEPCIPFLGVFLRDLVVADEANPNFKPNGEFNVDKLQIIAKIHRLYHQKQKLSNPSGIFLTDFFSLLNSV